MPKRMKMSKSASKSLFRKTGSRTHKKNVPKTMPKRGGIRL